MSDHSAVREVPTDPAPEGTGAASAGVAGFAPARTASALPSRLLALWHRIRCGEDPVAFGAVAVVVALAAGLAWFWVGARHAGPPAPSAAPTAGGTSWAGEPPPVSPPVAGPTATVSSTPATVAVHVAGAVARPGLHHLPPGSRVADAVARAGGKLPGADLDRLNLAARLVDGQKVLVTRRGEAIRPDTMGVVGGSGAGGVGAPTGADPLAPAEPIDLNTADLAALDSLPGIGPATARAILEERTRRGGFRSTRDLLRVPGIGDTRFARLKDLVRV